MQQHARALRNRTLKPSPHLLSCKQPNRQTCVLQASDLILPDNRVSVKQRTGKGIQGPGRRKQELDSGVIECKQKGGNKWVFGLRKETESHFPFFTVRANAVVE